VACYLLILIILKSYVDKKLSVYVKCVFEVKNIGVDVYCITHIMSIDSFYYQKKKQCLFCEFSVSFLANRDM